MTQKTDQLILKTARRHFVQNGYAATRMQDIADEAGINKALLHYYFRSKEKLYEEIIEQTLSMVIPRMAVAMGTEGDFYKRLDRVVETYITTLTEHPYVPFFIMSELSQKREKFIEKLKKRAFFFPAAQSFIQQMAADMEQGKIRNIPPQQLLLSITGMLVFPFMAKPVFSLIFNYSEPQFDELMEERKTVVIDLITNALKVG